MTELNTFLIGLYGCVSFLSLPLDNVKTNEEHRRRTHRRFCSQLLKHIDCANVVGYQLKIAANEESSRPACNFTEAVLSGKRGECFVSSVDHYCLWPQGLGHWPAMPSPRVKPVPGGQAACAAEDTCWQQKHLSDMHWLPVKNSQQVNFL